MAVYFKFTTVVTILKVAVNIWKKL